MKVSMCVCKWVLKAFCLSMCLFVYLKAEQNIDVLKCLWVCVKGSGLACVFVFTLIKSKNNVYVWLCATTVGNKWAAYFYKICNVI